MFRQSNWERYKPAMLGLPANRELTREDLMAEPYLMGRHGKLSMYFAPHNELVNEHAELVIVGITPGWTQMRIAFETAVQRFRRGESDEQIAAAAKHQARFAGAMRRNLYAMLHELGIPGLFGLADPEQLFEAHAELLHTTSLLRYPVFYGGRNYSGSQPKLTNESWLLDAAFRYTLEDLQALKQPLIIPLGKRVESVLELFIQHGVINAGQLLKGFPHPSGANGHRQRQFGEQAERMRRIMLQWHVNRAR
ncbi:hypothetical protein [Paenibacillus protaetiae]|uniref:Uracil-DNA glycosylase-like domain-containing protein n=1 Tax=Paenibacillus protaetiae TaxID=2509456 RepID=A0A4P6EZA1_9BACL|nr:hypothetical protein [Paenibacillus protaetiae]QAY67613.1 hypothetical protein ET464_15715 [Paenibacillus protaetiae]